MLSWTKPTLDQLIIRFNASKSINHATPMWNIHIYLTPNSVETNTHVPTLHSMISKQQLEIGQNTEWHFNAQPCRCSNPLRHSNLNHIRLTSPQYPVAQPGHQQLWYWTWHSWPESSQQYAHSTELSIIACDCDICHSSAGLCHPPRGQVDGSPQHQASFRPPFPGIFL